jgi:hypothetical protein
MTRDEKLQAIKEKCMTANPGRVWVCSEKCHGCMDVRLADVLLTLKASSEQDELNLGLPLELHHGVKGLLAKWNLRWDDLSEQSDETIDFIHSLICV